MRSPLEHEPELIAGIGLITVRWAALESELAKLLGKLVKVEPAGECPYYALSSVSARVDIVESLLIGSLRDDLAKRISKSLFKKIRRLWKSRNGLIHADYAYAEFDWEWNFLSSLSGEGPVLGRDPRSTSLSAGIKVYGPDGEEVPQPKVAHRGFAYKATLLNGRREWVVVNKGTFENHAKQLSKRIRQVRRLTRAVQTMEAPLNWDSFSSTSLAKCSPRGNRNQLEFLARQERKSEHQRQRLSSLVSRKAEE